MEDWKGYNNNFCTESIFTRFSTLFYYEIQHSH